MRAARFGAGGTGTLKAGLMCQTTIGCSIEGQKAQCAERIKGTMMTDALGGYAAIPQMAEEVIDGLREYAGNAGAALRSPELARKIGLGSRLVQVALCCLSANPNSGVVRRRRTDELWDKYWFNDAQMEGALRD